MFFFIKLSINVSIIHHLLISLVAEWRSVTWSTLCMCFTWGNVRVAALKRPQVPSSPLDANPGLLCRAIPCSHTFHGLCSLSPVADLPSSCRWRRPPNHTASPTFFTTAIRSLSSRNYSTFCARRPQSSEARLRRSTKSKIWSTYFHFIQ